MLSPKTLEVLRRDEGYGIEVPTTRKAHSIIFCRSCTSVRKRRIPWDNLIFNTMCGQYEGVKPDLGTKPSLGNDIFGWMAPLQFGNFGGLLSTLVWVMIGFVTSYVTLTGLSLWAERGASDPVWQRLSHVIPTVGYGMPIGMAASAFGFLLSFPKGDAVGWTAQGFLFGCLVAILLGVIPSDHVRLVRILSILLGALLAGLPFLRTVMGRADWGKLLVTASMVPIMLDVLLFSGGTFGIVAGLRPPHKYPRASPLEDGDNIAVPAE